MSKRNLPGLITLDVPNPHSITLSTAQACRMVGTGLDGMYHPRDGLYLQLRVSPESITRSLRIVDALAKGAETRGFSIALSSTSNGGAQIIVSGERIGVSIRERSRRVDHEPTKEELDRRARYSWSSIPKYDYVPSGDLTVVIVNSYRYETKWSDGKVTKLEERLSDVLDGIEASALRMIEIKAEKRRFAQEEWERQQRARDDEKRREDLERQMGLWRMARDIRDYVAAMSNAVDDELVVSELGAKLAWALEYADRIDPAKAKAKRT